MIVKYQVVEAWDPVDYVAARELCDKVDLEISKGWQPLGGVSVVYRPPRNGASEHYLYSQAMVRYAE